MSDNIPSVEPVVDMKMKELQTLLDRVDEDDDFLPLTAEEEKEVAEKMQELQKKYRSIGSALKAKDSASLDFLLSTFIYQDEQSRSKFQKKEERKEMLEQLLFFSVAEGNPATTEVLLKNGKRYELGLDLESKMPLPKPGSDPQRPDLRYVSAPFMAAENNNWEMLQWLIENGHLQLDARGNNDETLFMAAVANANFDLADKILALAPDMASILDATTTLYNQTALHAAAQVGDREALAYLIARRANPTIESFHGQLASEILPEEEEYKPDYDIMEDYRDAYMAGAAFAPPGEWYQNNKGEDPEWMKNGIPEVTLARRVAMGM